MIVIRNKQRSVKISATTVRSDAQKILAILGYADFGVGIVITTDRGIKAYNKKFRKRDIATDVLSFPYYQVVAGEKIVAHEDEAYLGDIVISAPYVARDAKSLDVSFEKRLQHILVHSMCHLIGYDHELESDYRRMRAKEAAVHRTLLAV